MSTELQSRKLLLDFYSAEINSHSRLFIGLAVLTFTLFQIKQNFIIGSYAVSWWQNGIIYFGVSLSAFALWYSLLRLFKYGALANAVIFIRSTHTETDELASELSRSIEERNGKIGFFIPFKYFESELKIGLSICVALALITALFTYGVMQ